MTTINNKTENNNSNFIDMETLVDKLKHKDAIYRKQSRNFVWLFWILVPIYFAIFIINPDKELQLINRLGGGCYVLAFVSFGIYFKSYYKDFKSVNYSLPTIEMLKKAAYRYKLFHGKTLTLLIPLLLIDAGLSLFFFEILADFEPIIRILIVQAFYLTIMAVSFFIGVLIWYKKQKPLRDRVLQLIDEIENEE